MENNSSSQLLTWNFKPFMIQMQKLKKTVNFTLNNSEKYYLPFSLLELKEALQKSNNSDIGLDAILHK